MPPSHSSTFMLSLIFGVLGYFILHVSVEIMILREDVRRLLPHSSLSSRSTWSDSSRGGYVGGGDHPLSSYSSSSSSSSLFSPVRRIPKTTAVRCNSTTTSTEYQRLLSQPRKYFKSQFGEDKILMSYFNNLCFGKYIEMGALNGYDASNTHVFHFQKHWSGVLLEASPTNYETLKVNRPSNEDIKIHAAICNTEDDDSSSSSSNLNNNNYGEGSNTTSTSSSTTTTKYLHWVPGKYTSTGGFWEFASEAQKRKFFVKEGLEKSTLVPCTKLSTIFEQLSSSTTTAAPLYFDFYTLDIEGAEYTALQTIDFTKVMFGMIVVEASKQNKIKDMSVRTLLESNGYRQFIPDQSDGMLFESDWFINIHWHEIYHDLIY